MSVRGALLLALALAVPARAAEPAPPPFVDLEAYLRDRQDEAFTILEHPQVRCLVAQLLPEADVALLDARLHRTKGAERLAARAEDGSLFWDGFMKSAGRCELGLLWVHPDGRIFGVVREDCGPLRAFTNDPSLLVTAPLSVAGWLAERLPAREQLEAWHVASRSGPSPRCALAPWRAALAAGEERRAGTLCDEGSPMSGRLAVVAPAGATRTALRARRPCPEGGKAEKPYLVAGDLVETGAASEGCTCVLFGRAESVAAGWAGTSDLVPLPRDGGWWPGVAPEAIQPFRAALGLLPPPPPLGGTWSGPHGSFSFRSEDGEHWTVSGDGWLGYRAASIDARLVRDGRLAWSEPPDGEAGAGTSCRIAVMQFNNALWVEDNGRCGGSGFSFEGVYRRQRPRPAP